MNNKGHVLIRLGQITPYLIWPAAAYTEGSSALLSHNTVTGQKTVTELTVDPEHGASLPSSDQISYSSSK